MCTVHRGALDLHWLGASILLVRMRVDVSSLTLRELLWVLAAQSPSDRVEGRRYDFVARGAPLVVVMAASIGVPLVVREDLTDCVAYLRPAHTLQRTC